MGFWETTVAVFLGVFFAQILITKMVEPFWKKLAEDVYELRQQGWWLARHFGRE